MQVTVVSCQVTDQRSSVREMFGDLRILLFEFLFGFLQLGLQLLAAFRMYTPEHQDCTECYSDYSTRQDN